MNFIASRLPALKFLGMFGVVQVSFTLFANYNNQSLITVQQYMQKQIKERSQFTLVGMLKPRSIKLSGGLQKKFTITDNNYDINCRFVGTSSAQLKEGQTAILTAYCPNIKQKQNIVVSSYMTKHSMQTNDWESKKNVTTKSYGLESFR